MTDAAHIDVLVVGGGPAGLAAALWLGRHRFTTVVADRGEPRNRWVDTSFGYLGFDNQPPTALLDAGREDLSRYPSVTLIPVGVRAIHRDDGGFEVELDDRRLRSSAVVFATGVTDVVPPLPGLRERYGTDVFVCPLCDGYEIRNKEVVVLGAGGSAGEFAEELVHWASKVTVVPLGDERPRDAAPEGVEFVTTPAAELVGSPELGVVLSDGSTVSCGAVFLRSECRAVTDLAAHLGCALDDEGLLVVDDDGCTSVPDVYAAGDCTPGPQIVQIAAAEGTRAGLRCAQELMARR